MNNRNSWFVITGGPSSGKTTVISELERLGYKTIPEAARKLIDTALANGKTIGELRADEKLFQEKVARLKGKNETDLESDIVTFFDRGMHDSAAYLNYYGYNISHWIEKLLKETNYQKVFLLDPLPYFKDDYARTEGHDFPEKIHKLLHDAYVDFGMKPIRVPVMSPSKRAEFILAQIDSEENK